MGASSRCRGWSSSLATDAQVVAEVQRRISAAVGNTTWTGPAAERFRSEWSGTFVSALTRLQEALHENAAVVRNRRQAIQTATS